MFKKEINYKFREEATLVLAGFHVGALSSLNWRCWFLRKRKTALRTQKETLGATRETPNLAHI